MPYAQQSDVEAVFGPTAVAAWSLYQDAGTVSGVGPANAARVAAALAYADAEVNAALAGGPYAVPLQPSSSAAPAVAYWAAVIAGCWLYGGRASVSYVDYAGNRYLALRAAVYADLHRVKAGVKRLDAALKGVQPSGPTAVGDW